jgi:Zn-dependent membrane protease YugP
VKNTFRRYSDQLSSRHITGAMAAERVLRANGVHGVAIEQVAGDLTDHYDPKANVIRLSDSVYHSTSTAAIGVACHEAGHAVQYAEHYAPIKLRAAIIPITNIGSRLAFPLIFLGILLAFMGNFSYFFVYLGIACFGLSLLFQLLTLPVEFNASRRAMAAISDGELLTPDEQRGARKTLTAAALTYVAATALALAQLLRLISLYGRRRRN